MGPVQNLAYLSTEVVNTRVASGIGWLAETAQSLRLVPEAQAQGFGYQTLGLTRGLWTQTRNMAYAFIIFVILILAFMIMFRVQISPRVVVTVQSALPKIAVTLILITFSYAIAGLLVDLAFLIQGLFASMVAPLSWQCPGQGCTVSWQYARMQNYNDSIWSWVWIVLFNSMLYGGILGKLGIVTLPIVSNVLDTIIGIIVILIIFITMIRILWTLIRHFFVVFLLVVAGPFMILLGAVKPEVGFVMWLKQLIANL